MGIENRIHERKPIKCRVVIVTDNEKHKIPGTTIDMSLGGAGLLLDENLPMGQNCTAHFRFPRAGYRDISKESVTLALRQFRS